MSTAKIERIVRERDLLKKENYTLRRENSQQNKTLKSQKRVIAKFIEMMKRQEQEFKDLKKRIAELERAEKQLPHIILVTQKLISKIQHNSLDKSFFGSCPEDAIENIAYHFNLTQDDAKSVWNYFLFYR
ncbi:MAG: hypothetical protein ACTSQE_10800 [Candidatus Heimdallarchaeaceae archaeon]